MDCRPLKDRSRSSRAVRRCLTMPLLYPAGLAPTNLQQNRAVCRQRGNVDVDLIKQIRYFGDVADIVMRQL